ncbi:putative deacetylase LmbE-like domain-containing protein [Abortiporus biennis]|nr:putative deacetylase LmbE-like domain-containing protein [Abortiporus biennis]
MSSVLHRISLFVLCTALLLRILSPAQTSNIDSVLSSTDEKSQVLLLTAHPDDECLFFAPTILSLLQDRRFDVYSLCLSVGDAEGLGKIRRQELEQSLDVLGIENSKRWVVDSPALPDNITLDWDAEVIASHVRPYVLDHGISTVLTFDRQGVSLHPNHRSLPTGVAHLISQLSEEGRHPPKLLTLVTVPLVHKYISILAPVLAKFDLVINRFLQKFFPTQLTEQKEAFGNGRLPAFVSGIESYKTAVQAMKQHRSQLVWFRWLNVSFSRYLWVNEWVEYRPVSRTAAAESPIPSEE